MQNQLGSGCAAFAFAPGSDDELMQPEQHPNQQHPMHQFSHYRVPSGHQQHQLGRQLSPNHHHQRPYPPEATYLHLQPAGSQIHKQHCAGRVRQIASSFARQLDVSGQPAGQAHFRPRVASVSSSGSRPEVAAGNPAQGFLTRSTSFSNYLLKPASSSPVQYLQVSPPPPPPPATRLTVPSQPEDAVRQHQQQFAPCYVTTSSPSQLQYQQQQQPAQQATYSFSSPSSSSSTSNYSTSSNLAAISPSDALNLGINLEQYISKRNERERSRVKNVNDAFDNLKSSLPLDTDKLTKRMSKVEILRTAISYIKNLEEFLKQQQQQQQNQDASQRLPGSNFATTRSQEFSGELNSPPSELSSPANPQTPPSTTTTTTTTSTTTEFNSINVYEQTITSCNKAQSQQEQTQFATSQTMPQVAYEQPRSAPEPMRFEAQNSHLNCSNQLDHFHNSQLPFHPQQHEQQLVGCYESVMFEDGYSLDQSS